jgi:hypothetical protein
VAPAGLRLWVTWAPVTALPLTSVIVNAGRLGRQPLGTECHSVPASLAGNPNCSSERLN